MAAAVSGLNNGPARPVARGSRGDLHGRDHCIAAGENGTATGFAMTPATRRGKCAHGVFRHSCSSPRSSSSSSSRSWPRSRRCFFRSVYNPAVAELIPATLEAMAEWDGEGATAGRGAVAVRDRSQAPRQRQDIGPTGRGDEPVPTGYIQRGCSPPPASCAASMMPTSPRTARQFCSTPIENWAEPSMWRALEQAGQVYTSGYYLTALDLEMARDGTIRAARHPDYT